jgi:nicotinamidase-related amidase
LCSNMNDRRLPPPSLELMTPGDTGLLVIDAQEKILAAVSAGKRIAWNIGRLIRGAKILGLPAAATEQYPKGLGGTLPELAVQLGDIPSKLSFSCGGCPELFEDFKNRSVRKILLCGVETHVCVQQTALDLLADGWGVYVAVDSAGSRFDIDHRTALGRMDSAGATLTTVEAALFEWCGIAGTAEFKQISRLAQESAPE